MVKKRTAFTLIEILVVVAIIALLAGLLFPAFNRVRERGRQAHCATNLHQIGIAVTQYFQDEKRYPPNLLNLVPDDYPVDGNGAPTIYTGGTGYFKGGSAGLVCPSDPSDAPLIRSSYGDITQGTLPQMNPNKRDGYDESVPAVTTDDAGRYVWNYFGYLGDGTGYLNVADITTTPPPNSTTITGGAYSFPTNVMKYSLSNRYAPPQTIITHCIFHRPYTAANADFPGEIYTSPDRGNGARDIVLRLDGTAKLLDVSQWNASGQANLWQLPTP